MRIRHGGLDRGPEDPDAHRADAGVQPRREDAIPIVEDEPETQHHEPEEIDLDRRQ